MSRLPATPETHLRTRAGDGVASPQLTTPNSPLTNPPRSVRATFVPARLRRVASWPTSDHQPTVHCLLFTPRSTSRY